MLPQMLLAAGTPGSLDLDTDTRSWVLVGFLTFIVPMLLICVLNGPERDRVNDFYTAGRRLRPVQGAIVLSGVYLSAATVLGTTGTVAVFGFDGLFVALCTVLSLGVLLLLSGPLRERGSYTLGDTFALRAPGPAVRIAAAVVTLSACIPYLIVQLSGAGRTTAVLLGLSGPGAEQTVIVMIGTLVVCATAFGGMRGMIALQMIKTVFLLVMALAVAAVLLHRFHWSADSLIDAAAQGSGRPEGYLRPGLRFAAGGRSSTLDFVGLMITVVLGVACLPHVATQLNTAPDPAAARRTVRHTIGIVGAVCLVTTVMGFGAAAMIGAPKIPQRRPRSHQQPADAHRRSGRRIVGEDGRGMARRAGRLRGLPHDACGRRERDPRGSGRGRPRSRHQRRAAGAPPRAGRWPRPESRPPWSGC